MTSTIAIVGTGVAGASAALTLRSEGFDGRIVLIGDEPAEPYRRPPLSKELLKGTLPVERTALRPSSMWQSKNIELRTSTTVTDVDVDAHTLTLGAGEQLEYDKLLLATGGVPRPLPLAAGIDHVYMLRTIDDVPPLQERLASGSRVLIVGAGLIGSEIASTARSLDCDVVMLEAAPRPLSRLLPPKIADLYADMHVEHGVELHTGVDLTALEQVDGGVRATDADGRQWTVDTVVVSIGLMPRTELADKAGLKIDNGIVVDSCFQTSAPDVYAAGDVAHTPNLVLGGLYRSEHWQSAQEEGQAAAKAMLGDMTPFDAVPWCWSEQYGITVQVTGWPSPEAQLTVRGDLQALEFTAIFHDDARLLGAVGINRAPEIRAMRKVIAQAPDADPAQLADPELNLAKVDPATLARRG